MINNLFCSKCNTNQPIEQFLKHKGHRGSIERSSWCRTCAAAHNREWRKKNKEHVKNQRLLKQYDMTLEEYKQMAEQQNGVCAICGGPPTLMMGGSGTKEQYRLLDVDHDHNTGAIRGLLCNKCNRGIGDFEDNVSSLRNAADYLEKNNAK